MEWVWRWLPLIAGTTENSIWVGKDPNRVTSAPSVESACQEPQKDVKKSQLQQSLQACLSPPTVSGSHFTHPSEGYEEEAPASTSQLVEVSAGRNEWYSWFQLPLSWQNLQDVMSGRWKANAPEPWFFNFPPEFFFLIRQNMREEIVHFYH